MHSLKLFLSLAVIGVAACSSEKTTDGWDASDIREKGVVPQTVKLAAAELMERCAVPINGRTIVQQWEAREGQAPFTLSLTHEQMNDKRTTVCLAREAERLGIASEINFGEDPPPSPPEKG